MTRVIVAGSTGRVGRAMMTGLPQYHDVEVVGGFGSRDAESELQRLAARADVLVEFTTAAAAPKLLCAAAEAGLHVVSGTSGLSDDALDQVDRVLREHGRGGLWAANFAIGGVLMMYFARVAARFMD